MPAGSNNRLDIWYQSGLIEVAVISGKAGEGSALICSLAVSFTFNKSAGGKIPAAAVFVSDDDSSLLAPGWSSPLFPAPILNLPKFRN